MKKKKSFFSFCILIITVLSSVALFTIASSHYPTDLQAQTNQIPFQYSLKK